MHSPRLNRSRWLSLFICFALLVCTLALTPVTPEGSAWQTGNPGAEREWSGSRAESCAAGSTTRAAICELAESRRAAQQTQREWWQTSRAPATDSIDDDVAQEIQTIASGAQIRTAFVANN